MKWVESLETVSRLSCPFATIFDNHDDQPYVTVPLPWRVWIVPLLGLSMGALAMVVLIAELRGYALLALTACIPFLWMFIVGYPSTVMRRSLLHYECAHFGQYSLSREGPSSMHGLSNYYLLVTHRNQTALVFLLDSGGGRLEEKYMDGQLEWVRSVSKEHHGALSVAFAHIPSYEF